MKGRRRLGRAGLYVLLIVTAALMIVPFYWTVATSLKPAGDIFISPPKLIPDPFILDNYRDVFTLLPFGRFFLNSLIVTGSIVSSTSSFATSAAYAFAKLRFRGRTLIFGALLLTLMVPFQVNLIPLYAMMVRVHDVVPFLGADTYFGLIAPSAVQVFGMFLMWQYLKAIPDEVLEFSAHGWGVGVADPALRRFPAGGAGHRDADQSSPSSAPGTTSCGRSS